MGKVRISLLILTLWALFTYGQTPAGAAPAKPVQSPPSEGEKPSLDSSSSLSLEQFCETSGEQKVSLSPLGIKIYSKRKSITGMMLPPFTEIVFFNDKTRKILYYQAATFKNPFSHTMALLKGLTLNGLELHPVKSLVHHKLSTGHFELSPACLDNQKRLRMQKEIAPNSPVLVICFQTTKLKVAPQIISFMDKYYGLPHTEGLPLAFTYVSFRNVSHQYMSTSKVSPAKFTAGDYAIPKGYDRVKDFNALLLDDSSDDSIEMMFRK